MAKEPVKLTFPQHLIKEPVIYQVAKKYDLVPNIRRARVTETVGEVVLELEGKQNNLEKAKEQFIQMGVKVEPVEGDVIA